MNKIKQLPKVEVGGKPFEIGFAHGRSCRDAIQSLARESLIQEIGRYKKKNFSEIVNIAHKYERFIKQYAPHLIEEIRGISEGADISYNETLLLQCRSEVVYEAKLEGCTALGFCRNRTEHSEMIVAQNIDLSDKFEDYAIILHIQPQNKPDILTWTLSGTLGQVGINSAGLARCGNVLISPGWRVGLPTTVLFRCILEAIDIEEMLKFLEKCFRAKSNNFMVADRNGTLTNVETTVTELRKIEPENGVCIHTNHYLNQDFVPFEKFYNLPNSNIRLNRAKQLVEQATGKFNSDKIKSYLKDHYNDPDSICQHVHKKGSNTKTVASLLLHPDSQYIEACLGNPCGNEFYRYSL
jgi:predicted choloylglycine hydrolase